jgi:xanthine dehydrogenase accessory factor
MTCHSGGTLEIYVEPHLPAAHLWVVGTTPIAGALASLGSVAGWRVTVIDPIADPDAFPNVRVHRTADIRGLDPDVAPYVVVASQGIWDEEAVALALTREAAYVGLVASPTRAAVVREWLREETMVGEERMAALRAPAGLDLGAETAEEIALSILAELVQVRRGRADFVASPGPATVAGGAP